MTYLRALLVVCWIFGGIAPSVARAAPSAHLIACTVGRAKLHAHCGWLQVYEDRAAQAGRMLRLHVIEIDALVRTQQAVFWNPGGPGGADSSAVPYIADGLGAKELLALHDRYDLVFVDNRGTGLSHRIGCNLYPPADPKLYYAQLFPDGPLRACRRARSSDTNLSAYTTDVAADDLDDVRSALHYPRIVLDGGSYGTMFFLDYARRHPSHVESLVLEGVAPPGILKIPLEDAQGARTAMNDLISDCAHDVTCHRSFPSLASHFAALAARFDRGPVHFAVRNAVTRHEQEVALTKEVFADRLRQVLYAEEPAAYVPFIIEAAYRQNYEPLAQLIEAVTVNLGRGLDIGLNLSVTCAEDIPFITQAQVERSSAGSFEGDLRVRAQQRACAIWNVRRASSAFVRPVHSSAPILMLSGAEDPATPPEYGRMALPYLPNARQIVIPHAGHETESACTDALIVRFVRTRNARRLDAARCIARSRRPPFATSLGGFGK